MPISTQWLGQQAYLQHWQAMQTRANEVHSGQADEVIWGCEHQPVYTTGKRAADNRIQSQLPAPFVITDRGGETTFHGAGQLMLYPIIHLRQRKLGMRDYVCLLERSVIQLLRQYGISSEQRKSFPGVWTASGKIAALGVRVRNGVAYHGMALNVHVDLRYFQAIQPCGLSFQAVNMFEHDKHEDIADIFYAWADIFHSHLLKKVQHDDALSLLSQ